MKKRIILVILIVLSLFILIACDITGQPNPNDNDNNGENNNDNPPTELTLREENPNYDVYYQIFIKSFADSDNDGIGDIKGVINSLDYLQDLGVTAIWMLPFHVTDTDWSSYHGYRVKDYYNINPDYGTMEDLEDLIKEAHKRDMKVTMDLVINHVSDTHPWYLNSLTSGSEYSNWFTGHRSFPGGMVDLNKNNDAVKREIRNIMKFYLQKGIDGFRFDAAKHLFDFDQSSGQFASQQFLGSLRDYAKQINPDVLFLGEVFEYNYQGYNSFYMGLDSVFDFYTASQIWDKIGNTQGTSLVSNIARAYDSYGNYGETYIPALFISNHDVDRVAGFSQFNLERLKLAAAFMLTLPGSVHIYYGEELGMTGKSYGGEDFNGQGAIFDHYRRAPFIWGSGDSRQTNWLLPHDGSNLAPNVDVSNNNEDSLLNYYKQFIKLRKDNMALMYGATLTPWSGNNNKLQGFIREFSDSKGNTQKLLIIHNISNSSSTVDVDYNEIIYGDLNIVPYGTLIVEIE